MAATVLAATAAVDWTALISISFGFGSTATLFSLLLTSVTGISRSPSRALVLSLFSVYKINIEVLTP